MAPFNMAWFVAKVSADGYSWKCDISGRGYSDVCDYVELVVIHDCECDVLESESKHDSNEECPKELGQVSFCGHKVRNARY